MLATRFVISVSENRAKPENVYRFNPQFFWDGEWIEGEIREPEGSEFIRITRRE